MNKVSSFITTLALSWVLIYLPLYSMNSDSVIDKIIIGGIRAHNEESKINQWKVYSDPSYSLINIDKNIECDHYVDGFSETIEEALPDIFCNLKGTIRLVNFEHVKIPDNRDYVTLSKWASLLAPEGKLEYSGPWQKFDQPTTAFNHPVTWENGIAYLGSGSFRIRFLPQEQYFIPTYRIDKEAGLYSNFLQNLDFNDSYEINPLIGLQLFAKESVVHSAYEIFQSLNLTNIQIFIDKRFVDPRIPLYSFRISGIRK